MYKYAITIYRFNDDDTQETLIDRYITADQAIDAVIFSNNLDVEETEPVHSDEEEVEEEPEIEGYNAPIKGSMGTLPKERFGFEPKAAQAAKPKSEEGFDVQAVKVAIKGGNKPKDIAELYGISTQTVYQLKSKMKKEGELGDESQEDSSEEKKPHVIPTHAQKIKYMVNAGESDATIYAAMHDLMTDAEFREALATARQEKATKDNTL